MENVVVVIADISNVLLSGKEPMDPNDVIEYPEFAVVAAKTDSNNLQDTSVSTAQGQLIMPNASDLLKGRDISCIASKVNHSTSKEHDAFLCPVPLNNINPFLSRYCYSRSEKGLSIWPLVAKA